MKENLIEDFYIDKEKKCLHGKVEFPKFNLISSKIVIPNHPEIEGFVIEVFRVLDVNHVKYRAKGVEFNIGDWYVNIYIDKGWDIFNGLEVEDFYLEPREISEDYQRSIEEIIKLNPNSISKFKNMSNLFFPNFYIDLRGGETGGVGRNEHGKPHFHVISRKDNKDIGKVFFPTLEDYKINQTQLIFSSNIDRKTKKEITKWVFANDLKNIKDLNNIWFEQNKDNNRIHK